MSPTEFSIDFHKISQFGQNHLPRMSSCLECAGRQCACHAARGIAEVITHHYMQNIDLRDAKTVLSNSGTAIMGSSTSSSQNRAQEAITSALDSPLLNDNKITGAKNVLLLIVSGSQEITIDEIGEINDHIQAEAGYGANIIMGVGEDDSLGEAISVTIIATGFDVTQQNEITNTEVKKVVHALEDEQTMEHDLMPLESTNKPVNLQIEQEEIIVHDLGSETLKSEDTIFEAMDLVTTTELIKNFEVISQTVDLKVEENDFIINDVSTTQVEDNKPEPCQEDQTMLTFDLPISSKPLLSESDEVEIFTLEDNINQIEVNDYIELIPVNEVNESGETRYALDDHIILEQTDKKFDQVKQETPTQVEEEIVLKKVIIKERELKSEPTEKQDPFNYPISKTLIDRADERRQKMKAFNYKFNSSKIEEIEKEPAYKRQGVSLSDVEHSSDSQTSRTTIGLDDNDEVQLRSNNSYLHDNVD